MKSFATLALLGVASAVQTLPYGWNATARWSPVTTVSPGKAFAKFTNRDAEVSYEKVKVEDSCDVDYTESAKVVAPRRGVAYASAGLVPAAEPQGSYSQALSGTIAAFGNRRTVQQGYASMEHPNMRLLRHLGREPEKEGKDFGYATLTSTPVPAKYEAVEEGCPLKSDYKGERRGAAYAGHAAPLAAYGAHAAPLAAYAPWGRGLVDKAVLDPVQLNGTYSAPVPGIEGADLSECACADGICGCDVDADIYQDEYTVVANAKIESEPRHIIPKTVTTWGHPGAYGYGVNAKTVEHGKPTEWQPLYLQPGYHNKRPSHFLW